MSHTYATTLHARKLWPEECTTVSCNFETCLADLLNDTKYQINSVLILRGAFKYEKVLNVRPNAAKTAKYEMNSPFIVKLQSGGPAGY